MKKYKVVENYIIENKNDFYKIAYSYTRNSEDALDIVQETIYKALKTSESLKEPKYIKTWFYNILIHTAIDFLRKNKKYVLSDEEFIFDNNGKYDIYEDLDLKKVLKSLPSDQHTIIILRYYKDLKLNEIAKILNENLSTIKSRLYKALKALKLELSAQEVKENE